VNSMSLTPSQVIACSLKFIFLRWGLAVLPRLALRL
jgi:hypothetical protein